MATETAFRPRVDQENASALDIKGGNVSGIKLSLKQKQNSHWKWHSLLLRTSMKILPMSQF